MRTHIPAVDQVLRQTLALAEARFGAEAVKRISASTLTAYEPTSAENPRQRPTWLHAPGLAERPFWKREHYGRLGAVIEALEEAQPAIRRQIADLDPTRSGVPYDHLTVAPEAIRGWKNLFFFRDYLGDDALLAKVDSLASIARRFGPEHLDRFELFLSVLEPNTHIPAHFGGTNLKLTLHLPLWIPDGDTALVVDGETRRWGSREMLVFDDTYAHEAYNRTNELRAVLLLKAYHPELSAEEVGVLEMLAPLNARVYREALKQKAAR